MEKILVLGFCLLALTGCGAESEDCQSALTNCNAESEETVENNWNEGNWNELEWK